MSWSLILMIGLQADLPEPPVREVATVTKSVEHDKTEYAIYRTTEAVGRHAQYLVRRMETGGGATPAVMTARSETCPALRRAITDLDRLEVPRLWIRDIGPVNRNPAGLSYSMKVPLAVTANGSSSMVEIRSLGPSPLAAWFERSESRLSDCWSSD